MSELAISTQAGLMPAITIGEAVDRYNAIIEFTKTVMTEGKDYGTIPGSSKPTLLKPGGEKLCNLFGLVPDFGLPIDKIVDFDNGLFYFQYRCDLYRNGDKVGSGIGSCNSKETKYRYRWVNTTDKPDKAEAEKLKADGIGRWRKSGNAWVWQERHENTEPFELVNTIDKMAQKRAFIAAVLVAVNASEFFTQDIEDLNIIEGNVVVESVAIDAETQLELTKGESISLPHNDIPDPDPEGKPETNGKVDIYQAVVDAGLSENIHSAKTTLQNYCQTGYDTAEKAIEWFRAYRGWRDSDLDPKDAAEKANKGELPK